MILDNGLCRIRLDCVDKESSFYEFWPSIENMSKIAKPSDMLEFIKVATGHYVEMFKGISELGDGKNAQFSACCNVLIHCANSDDISPLIGFWDKYGRYQRGAMSADEVIILANHLIGCGIIGEPPKKGETTQSIKDIDLYLFADIVVKHLDIPKEKAQLMSKIEIDRLILKNNQENQEQPGISDHEMERHRAAMKMLDDMEAEKNGG